MQSGTSWANKTFKFSYTMHSRADYKCSPCGVSSLQFAVHISTEFWEIGTGNCELGSGEETAAAATGHLESHPKFECPCPLPLRFLFLFQYLFLFQFLFLFRFQIQIHRIFSHVWQCVYVCAC